MARMRTGVHPILEREADRLIRESLKGVTSHSDKRDILTAWKQADRHRKEVYVTSGSPDASVRRGMFHRAASTGRPHLNSRDGLAGASRVRQTSHSIDSLGAFVLDNLVGEP